jgi:hypothetical protein
MGHRDPRVDTYIGKAPDFARPILEHLRDVVHAACPQVEEDIKWGAPHFLHHGMLASMAAFKAHACFGFWRGKELFPDGRAGGAMGDFGKLTSVRDLPAKKTLTALVKQAMALNESGAARPKRVAKAKAPPVPSPAFAAALGANRKAARVFADFPPGQQREYVAWIDEAKGEDTRARRIAQAVEWIAEGKRRNWKYENC